MKLYLPIALMLLMANTAFAGDVHYFVDGYSTKTTTAEAIKNLTHDCGQVCEKYADEEPSVITCTAKEQTPDRGWVHSVYPKELKHPKKKEKKKIMINCCCSCTKTETSEGR